MKKRVSTIISLLLALLMLAGCGADAASTVIVYERQPEEREMLRFEDIEYIRPELDTLYDTGDALLEALENPFKLNEAAELLDRFLMECSNFDTMYMLAYIRSCMDVHDEFYDEEYGWCMVADAERQLVYEEVMLACEDSVHLSSLVELFGEDIRLHESELSESTDISYEDYIYITERQAALMARYRDLAVEAAADIESIAIDYNELDAAYEAYYEKYNPILAELYIELIELQRERAGMLGYDSFAELVYEFEYDRDYSVEDVLEYLDYIKKHLAPIRREVQEQGLEDLLIYDPVDERELELYLETVAWGFGGRIEEVWRFMKQYDLYDFEESGNKAEISFQAYLGDYKAPYLFLYPYCDTGDIMTMCHEFGHYADSYIRQGAYENTDLAETFSQTMQLLSIDQLLCVMTEDEFYSYSTMVMLDILSSFVEQAALAEFEIRAHEMENPTVEDLNRLCLEISEAYGLYVPGEDLYYSMYWVDIPHLFESPFYVISYAVSASAALELYEMELEEAGSGVESFITMSESGVATLMEAVDATGLEDPLSEESVRQAAEFIRSRLPM